MGRSAALVMASSAMTAVLCIALNRSHPSLAAEPPAKAVDDLPAQVAQLQLQVKALQALVPDQAAVMTHVGYHFSNLWFAVRQQNWPLADFYLSETRNDIKWAVRAKPIRKNADGQEIDLNAIAQAIDNGPMTDLKKAIVEKSPERTMAAYEQVLVSCYGCHKAASKPYLRPHHPDSPEASIVNFDPNATQPE